MYCLGSPQNEKRGHIGVCSPVADEGESADARSEGPTKKKTQQSICVCGLVASEGESVDARSEGTTKRNARINLLGTLPSEFFVPERRPTIYLLARETKDCQQCCRASRME